MDRDLQLHDEVLTKGYPNRWGARIPVPPSGRLPSLTDPGLSSKNHKGATEFLDVLRRYINKEMGKGAVMGPYPSKAKSPSHP